MLEQCRSKWVVTRSLTFCRMWLDTSENIFHIDICQMTSIPGDMSAFAFLTYLSTKGIKGVEAIWVEDPMQTSYTSFYPYILSLDLNWQTFWCRYKETCCRSRGFEILSPLNPPAPHNHGMHNSQVWHGCDDVGGIILSWALRIIRLFQPYAKFVILYATFLLRKRSNWAIGYTGQVLITGGIEKSMFRPTNISLIIAILWIL